jgi:hypothetical protein
MSVFQNYFHQYLSPERKQMYISGNVCCQKQNNPRGRAHANAHVVLSDPLQTPATCDNAHNAPA